MSSITELHRYEIDRAKSILRGSMLKNAKQREEQANAVLSNCNIKIGLRDPSIGESTRSAAIRKAAMSELVANASRVEKWYLVAGDCGSQEWQAAAVDSLIEDSCCSAEPALAQFVGNRGASDERRNALIELYGESMRGELLDFEASLSVN